MFVRSVSALLALTLAASGCDFAERCPGSVADALAAETADDGFVATGYVIRFVPSPQLESRGYEINVAVDGMPNYETYFLRMSSRAPGFDGAESVLLFAAKTDRTHVLVPGPCEPLTAIPEGDVEYATKPPRQ